MSDRVFNPDFRTTSPTHRPGQRMTDHRGHEFVYVKASAHAGDNSVVAVDHNFNVAPVQATNLEKGRRVGVAESQFNSGEYGWVSVFGTGLIDVLANAAANAQLYTSATAGALDDASASQEAVNGIVLNNARGASAGTTLATWTWPTG